MSVHSLQVYGDTYPPDFSLFYVCNTDSYRSRFTAKMPSKIKVADLWKTNCIALTLLFLIMKLVNPLIKVILNY